MVTPRRSQLLPHVLILHIDPHVVQAVRETFIEHDFPLLLTQVRSIQGARFLLGDHSPHPRPQLIMTTGEQWGETIAFLKELKFDRRLTGIPVIIIDDATLHPMLIDQGTAFGLDGALTVPTSREDFMPLIDRIRQMLAIETPEHDEGMRIA